VNTVLDEPPMSLKAWYVYFWQRRTTVAGYAISLIGALATAGHAPAWVADLILIVSGGGVAGIGHLNNSLLKRQSQEAEKANP